MRTVETKLAVLTIGDEPKLSLAIATSGGEIRVSLLTDDAAAPKDFVARPSSPPYNLQNAGAALAETVTLAKKVDTLITILLLNNSQQPSTAHVEVACYSGDGNTALVPIVDEQAIVLAVGQSWSDRVLIKMA